VRHLLSEREQPFKACHNGTICGIALERERVDARVRWRRAGARALEDAECVSQPLAAFEAAWNEVLAEQSAADPTFKKVADSYLAFRKVYKTWGDAQALKATYLSK
jgi:TRAP-type mannitol/chloroaromatic compound transport system substrate-binding protein